MSNFILALPSKGRLQEDAAAHLSEIGLPIRRIGGERAYRAIIPAMPDIELQLLSSQEIAEAILSGAVHAGIVGEDLLREASEPLMASAVIPAGGEDAKPFSGGIILADRVFLAHGLGFGRADLIVAVSMAWIDVVTMADLDDAAAAFRQRSGKRMRGATKYPNLARRFFASHGVGNCRFTPSLGATEGAPAAGAAEFIIDITTSGATLADNHLRPLGDGLILQSQAQLALSMRAEWSESTLAIARELVLRFEARARGRAEARLLLAPGAALSPAAREALCAEFSLAPFGEFGLAGAEEDVRRASSALATRQGAPAIIARLQDWRDEISPRFDLFAQRIGTVARFSGATA